MSIALSLEGRVAVVTGGAGSIGAAIAWRLADAGATVATIDRSDARPAAAHVASQVEPDSVLSFVADLTDDSSVEAVMDAISRKLGSPSILVNAAGVLRVSPLERSSDDLWRDSMEVNVLGTMRAIRGALPYLRAAEESSVVNIASVAAGIGSRDGSPYSASKGAVISMTYAHAGELAQYGIRVNCVSPGWVEGGFTEEGRRAAADPDAFLNHASELHYLNRLARPSEIADAVVWLASPLASFVTGSNLIVDGGFSIKHG